VFFPVPAPPTFPRYPCCDPGNSSLSPSGPPPQPVFGLVGWSPPRAEKTRQRAPCAPCESTGGFPLFLAPWAVRLSFTVGWDPPPLPSPGFPQGTTKRSNKTSKVVLRRGPYRRPSPPRPSFFPLPLPLGGGRAQDKKIQPIQVIFPRPRNSEKRVVSPLGSPPYISLVRDVIPSFARPWIPRRRPPVGPLSPLSFWLTDNPVLHVRYPLSLRL